MDEIPFRLLRTMFRPSAQVYKWRIHCLTVGRKSHPHDSKTTDLSRSAVPLLGQIFPSPIKNTSQVPDAVAMYRKILAAQPHRSVAISSIGIHTNLAGLLKSGPDEYSQLSGEALVAEKVFRLAVMGGKYPESALSPECNFCGGARNAHNHDTASAASAYVAKHWPDSSELIWSG